MYMNYRTKYGTEDSDNYIIQSPLLAPIKNICEYNLFCTHCFPYLTAAAGVADTDAAAGDQQVLSRPLVLG